MENLIDKINRESKEKFINECSCPICGANKLSYKWDERIIDDINVKNIVFKCDNCGEETDPIHINDKLISIQLYLKATL
jgi:transcription elongation factor Elf1